MDDAPRLLVVEVLLDTLQNTLDLAGIKVHLVLAVLEYGFSASQVGIRVGSTVGIKVYVCEGIHV